MATKDKPNNKNLKALFSVICLCIIALGLIVYFSTQSSANNEEVNEATTIAQTETTEVQKRVTVKESTTVEETSEEQTSETTTLEQETTTQPVSMEANETNTPYKSFYKYPCEETSILGYTQELVKNETMGDYRAHTAVDFKGTTGCEVLSINDGLVLSVEKDNLLGTVVEIDHGGKLVAKYCGLNTVNVSVGDYVTIGQVLGTLGSVPFESKSESHLHFETKLDGEYVNPLDVMGKTE
jgi:murein DD-endopeptidase MepM/ murein hydrolase activator NlpD